MDQHCVQGLGRPALTNRVSKDQVKTRPEQKVAADFLVPPVEVNDLDAHSFRTHHLLCKGLVSYSSCLSVQKRSV